ncbi:MAG: hypothetical protein JO051_02170, partial [Acidobacteriaceae bacterium]|nr:hypothetical protein [Acidobacteriaceae bacterium]
MTNLKHISFVAAAGLFVAGTVTLHAQTPNGGAGPRPVAILLCQYPDKPDTYGFKPADILATWMSNTLMVNGAPVDNSINGLVQEASGGTVNFQGTQAFGWFTLPNPFSSYATGYDAGNDCIATAQSKGVNLTPFVYAAIYMNDKLADAMGESWPATLPTASPTGAHALIVSYAGLVSPPLVLHELGHILSTGGQHTDSGSDPLGAASWLGSLGTPPNLTTVAPEWDASRRELMGFIPSVATFSGGTQTYNLSRLTQP